MLPTILCLAIATGVKYFAILLVPFLVIYHYRHEKPSKRILYACGWAVLFVLTLVGCYLVYTQDLEVLKGILVQQSKYAQSIFLIFALQGNMKLAGIISKGCMLAFIIIYSLQIIKLLFTQKKLTFSGLMREYSWLLVVFIFGTITNFQSWYCLWLLPTIFWQRGKTAKQLLAITIAVELANTVFFVLYEYYGFGQYYYILMLILIFVFSKIDVNKKRIIGGSKNEKSIQRT